MTIERRWSFLVVSSGKAVGQVEAHLVAEDGEGADAGAVVLLDALVEDSGEELEIGLHGRTMAGGAGVSKGGGGGAPNSSRSA
jgi:hypothetical protein